MNQIIIYRIILYTNRQFYYHLFDLYLFYVFPGHVVLAMVPGGMQMLRADVSDLFLIRMESCHPSIGSHRMIIARGFQQALTGTGSFVLWMRLLWEKSIKFSQKINKINTFAHILTQFVFLPLVYIMNFVELFLILNQMTHV